MNAAYLSAAIPEPFTILGQRLRPFCLGHELLFQRFGNNFSIESSEAPTYEDLILGVLICAHDFDGALSTLKSRWLPLKLKVWGWKCGRFDVSEKMRLFRDYIHGSVVQPEYVSTREGSGGSPGAPFVQTLKVTLMAEFGVSEAEALDTPYSLAIWNYLTHSENKGSIHIVTDEDRENRKKAEELGPAIEAWGARVMAQYDADAARKAAK